MNFSIAIKGQSVAAAAAPNAAAVAIDAAATATRANSDWMIYNPGPGTVHVVCGGTSAQADATCMPILAGEKGAWSAGRATHLAAYSPSGAQNLLVFVGDGE